MTNLVSKNPTTNITNTFTVNTSIITIFFLYYYSHLHNLHSFPTRRSSDLDHRGARRTTGPQRREVTVQSGISGRSEEHTSELESHVNIVCRLLLENKNANQRHALTLSMQISIIHV